MTTVTLDYAKEHLSRLLAEVEAGGEVVIARDDKPVARLVAEPMSQATPKRWAGMWRDREGFGFSESFFDPLPEDELRAWEGDDGDKP